MSAISGAIFGSSLALRVGHVAPQAEGERLGGGRCPRRGPPSTQSPRRVRELLSPFPKYLPPSVSPKPRPPNKDPLMMALIRSRG